MNYRIELDMSGLMLIRRLLGQLPHDEVAPLISNITAQMAAQEMAPPPIEALDRQRPAPAQQS